jgi:hypothetical protein
MPALINSYTSGNVSADRFRVLQTVHEYWVDQAPSSGSILILEKELENYNFENSKFLDVLEEVEKLSDNWDGEAALKPSGVSIENAKVLCNVLSQFHQRIYNIAPGPNAEILVDLRNRQRSRSVEIIFYADKSVFIKFPEEGMPEQQMFQMSELANIIAWLNAQT